MNKQFIKQIMNRGKNKNSKHTKHVIASIKDPLTSLFGYM